MSPLVLLCISLHLVGASVVPVPSALLLQHRARRSHHGNQNDNPISHLPEDSHFSNAEHYVTFSDERSANATEDGLKLTRFHNGTTEHPSNHHHHHKYRDRNRKNEESADDGDTTIDQGEASQFSLDDISTDLFEEPKLINASTFVIGLRIEAVDNEVNYEPSGITAILTDNTFTIRLLGHHFTNQTIVRFVKDVKSRGAECDETDGFGPYATSHIGPNGASATVQVTLSIEQSEEFFFICIRENNTDIPWVHQGSDPWMTLKVYERLLPIWAQMIFIILLLMLSGLFAGLTLGLMALDRTDLKILAATGSEKERMYAKTILPLRQQGNYLLCSLVLGNVLINSSLTILLDELTSGLLAVTLSTIGIVVFGEIIPQAFCSRNGLAIGAKTILITRLIMLLTFPLSYVISVILDKVLGEEIGIVYNREKLKELVKITIDRNDLEVDEVNIISGALELKKKTVKDIMRRIDDIFMLPSDAVLDYETMAEIEYQGYSRIPVYKGERSNVVALINVKQLTLLDASDKIPLRLIMDYYKTDLFFVFEYNHLDFMFKAFREGSRGHMAFVQRIVADGPGDPYYETVGMLTMEDVLEEILQTDIRDENDIEKINARAGNPKRLPAVVPFKEKKKAKNVVEVPATLIHAATQYLSTSVDPFKHGTLSLNIIQRLLKTNVQFVKAPKRRGRQKDTEIYLYEAGKAADCFILILEGRVHVTIGKERLMYEAGPFSAYGSDFLLNDSLGNERKMSVPLPVRKESILSSPTDLDPSERRASVTSVMSEVKGRVTFIPDYSVKVLTDVYFLRVRYEGYRHALAATELERTYIKNHTENPEIFHNNESDRESSSDVSESSTKERSQTPTLTDA